MIAAVVGIAIAARADTALRTAAEFTDCDDKRVVEHTAIIQVGDQPRETGVQHWR